MSTAVLTPARNGIGLRRDETVGLIVAGVAHVAIIAALAINALRAPPAIPPPERVTVNLSEDVGLEASAAQVAPEGKASVADRIGEEPTPPKPVPQPKAEQPKPAPPKPAPPKPVPKAAAKPVVSPRTSAVAPRPAPPKPVPKAPGASRIGSDFLDGKGSKADADAPVAASQIGAADRASLVQAVARQLKRYWRQPSGVDVDKLSTVIEWELNDDGTLKGAPRFISQTGQTDSNKPQQGLHRDAAIRAIRQAAPFDLPPKFYNGWKKLRFTFDWNLNS
ncbi:MAG: energy transducer TonB [Novosphingobium sp.]|nr:energy transducer TonB [Novosphingobium sp.]MBO9603986.1 energy transducer TonB [Novosphingobium sp.]